MPGFLKGNYDLPGDSDVESVEDDSSERSLTEQFEESALAMLGGSICFVRKDKTLLWTGELDEDVS